MHLPAPKRTTKVLPPRVPWVGDEQNSTLRAGFQATRPR
jgi:hypothetical protein